MKLVLRFDILPQPKERPRFARRGDFVQTFTAKKTANFEKTIALMAGVQMRGMAALTAPLQAGVIFKFKKPKKTKLHSPGKDIDNLIKSLLDSLNGIAYADDKQIWAIHAVKTWADSDGIILELSTETEDESHGKA